MPGCIVDNPLIGDPGGHGGGHGGGGHGGGHHGGGRPGRGFRGGRGDWWWGGPWWNGGYRVDTTCTAWGLAVPMNPELHSVGTRLLAQSGGQPASAYVGDTLYLFSFADGVISARPCAAQSSALSDAPAPPGALYFLYQTADPQRGWQQVGAGWMLVDDAKAQMVTILAAAPQTQIGAYVWDGSAMTWKFLI